MIYNLIGEITHIIFFVYLIRIKWLICFNYITGLNIDCEHFSKNVGFSDKIYFLLLLLTFYMIYCFKGEIKHLFFFVYLIRIKLLIFINIILVLSIDSDYFSKNVGFSDKFNFLLLLLTFNMIFCLKGEIKPVIFFVVTIRIKLHLFVNEIQCFDLDIDDSIKNVGFFYILIFYIYFNIWCDFTLYWGNIIHSFHRHKNVHQLAPFIW